MDDLERMISLVQTPTGDDATRRLAAQYRATLVGRGADAEDRVIARIESGRAVNLPALFDVLAAFGTTRAAQALFERLIEGPEGVSQAAAAALATYPTPPARDALRRAAERDDIDPETRALVVRLREKLGTAHE
jgi:hypothetical protein